MRPGLQTAPLSKQLISYENIEQCQNVAGI